MSITVSLPAEQASYINDQVAAGAYASASDVVTAGLNALRERDAAADDWLRDAVGPVVDAMVADPGRAIPAATVFDALRAHHARRVRAERDA